MIRTDEKDWYKQFWPWFLIALPTIVIIACFYTMYVALNNPLSMVKKDYYQEGLTINKNIAELEKARELGLLAKIQLVDNRGMRIELTSSGSLQLPGALNLQFNHPVDDSKDLSITLHKTPDGFYNAEELTEQQWRLITTEKHWYVQLQSIDAVPSGKLMTGWILQGEAVQGGFDHLTLEAGSG